MLTCRRFGGWEGRKIASSHAPMLPCSHAPRQRHGLAAQFSHAHAAWLGVLCADFGIRWLARPESAAWTACSKPNTFAIQVLYSTLVLLNQDALACRCPCRRGCRVSRPLPSPHPIYADPPRTASPLWRPPTTTIRRPLLGLPLGVPPSRPRPTSAALARSRRV